ncbi:MAG: hypothetical protein AAF596_11075 [Planctomycetota bacterium]
MLWRSERYLNLYGDWDFNWFARRGDVPSDWAQPTGGVTQWGTIPVPDI